MRTLNFNPQGPRGPRLGAAAGTAGWCRNFNPQGPRGPRPVQSDMRIPGGTISIHKALAGLDDSPAPPAAAISPFQSTRPSRASTCRQIFIRISKLLFQSTRPSRASTQDVSAYVYDFADFNPQGPRGPRRQYRRFALHRACYFNPQGPRGPRR